MRVAWMACVVVGSGVSFAYCSVVSLCCLVRIGVGQLRLEDLHIHLHENPPKEKELRLAIRAIVCAT